MGVQSCVTPHHPFQEGAKAAISYDTVSLGLLILSLNTLLIILTSRLSLAGALAPLFTSKPGKNALLYFAGVVVVVVVVVVDIELAGPLL